MPGRVLRLRAADAGCDSTPLLPDSAYLPGSSLQGGGASVFSNFKSLGNVVSDSPNKCLWDGVCSPPK